jgi:hypothetical protein
LHNSFQQNCLRKNYVPFVRITTAAIILTLNFMGALWADRTVERELAALMDEGVIDNPPDARPRGYALVRNGGEGE